MAPGRLHNNILEILQMECCHQQFVEKKRWTCLMLISFGTGIAYWKTSGQNNLEVAGVQICHQSSMLQILTNSLLQDNFEKLWQKFNQSSNASIMFWTLFIVHEISEFKMHFVQFALELFEGTCRKTIIILQSKIILALLYTLVAFYTMMLQKSSRYLLYIIAIKK